ncbi:MAG: Fic family protein [Planctomycetota bacterium]|nr:MAG: Fic family protein [Planctomycetota bacterium]
MYDEQTIATYVYHSNRLDGLTLDLDQTQQILAGTLVGDRIPGEDGRTFEAEVVTGHKRAFEGMLSLAGRSDPVTQEAIGFLHKLMMGELLLSAGEYRECTLKYKGLLIASPPDKLAERMAWLVNLINTGLERAQDAHKFSWRVHHEFITLHPFIEANGRIARLLLNLVRLRRGLDLSIVTFESREQYSRAIIEFQQQKIRRAQEKLASGEF